MARSNNSFIKKLKAEEKKKKRQEKQDRQRDKKENVVKGSMENMIAYVDKFGNITNDPPEELNSTNAPLTEKEPYKKTAQTKSSKNN